MRFINKYWIPVVFILLYFFNKPLCGLFFGTLFTFRTIKAALFLRRLEKKGIEATGEVVEYQSDDEGNKTPLIEFTTATGDHIKEQPSIYLYINSNKISSNNTVTSPNIPIIYDADKPTKFVLQRNRRFVYILSLVIILVGLVCIGIAIKSFLASYAL